MLRRFHTFFIWTTGIVFARLTWRKHPQVSLRALTACAIQILQSVCGTLFFFEATRGPVMRGWSAPQMNTVFTTVNYVRSALSATAWVLALLAIFRWRARPDRILGHDGQYLPRDFSNVNITERT